MGKYCSECYYIKKEIKRNWIHYKFKCGSCEKVHACRCYTMNPKTISKIKEEDFQRIEFE